ncbi:hypothetical protein AAC387_Pa11g1751 [Persea americana]
MAEEIELLEVQDIPVEEGAGIDADNAEDVVIDLSWLGSMEEKLASTYRTESSPFTICRVPANIRECDHAAYNPRIVSIGPFHRGRATLQAMEEHKWRYLHKVLAFGEGRNNLEKFLKKMKEIETQARNCYSENIQMSSREFVEMMVLDGSFIVFFFLQRIHFVKLDVLIFGNRWMSEVIRVDMLLLENQLPFIVLERLCELIGLPRATLWNGAFSSFGHFFPHKLELKSPEEHVFHHLLHLLHLSLKPDSPARKAQTTSACGKLSSLRLCQHIGKTLRFLCPKYLIDTYDRFRTPSQQSLPKSKDTSPQQWNVIPSATELQEAGVRFQLKHARSFLQVRFEQGLMEMSRLDMYDRTGILFRNFIAFEQCFRDFGNHFSSYCMFVDFLVNTPRDVSILREADIIRSGLGSDKEVALLLNKLCKEIVWSSNHNYLADLLKEVNQHTQKRCPKWRAKLVHDYFSNPWAIISLIAGVIILVLTFLQTYFSVFGYFNPPKP